MRTRDAALGSTDLSNALGTHSVVSYYDVVSPVVVATARINQASFAYPLITLTVDNTVDWTQIEIYQDAWIGTSAGASDIGVYRVKGSTSTTLVIGETAQGDAGLLIQPLRSAAFADNQYVTIVQRRSIWSVYPLISGGTFFENYNQLEDGFNTYPPPITSILCTTPKISQYNHIWTFVDDGQTYTTITFTVTADAWPGNSIVGYAWIVPGSWTVTGGDIATDTFTAQVPASATNYELRCDVVNDQVKASTRIIEVWVKTRTGATAPLVMSSLQQVSWNATGAALSFTLNDNLLSNIPDGSMVVIAQERLFNGAVIQTAVSQFVGWIARIGQTTEPGLKSATPEFITVDGLLSLKRGTSQVWQTVTTVATWQQVPAALCSLSFAQFWLLSQRARGVLHLFDFIPASLTATGQRLPRLDVRMATLWQQLVSLADGHQKRLIGCDPDGTIWVSQHPSLNPTYPRTSGAVVVRDTHDASIYHDMEWPREFYPKVGIVEGSAFSWDGSSVLPTPLLSIGPGDTPGQGANDQKCENQVVDSQATLNALTGNYLAFLNPDYPDVTVNYQGMRGSLIKPAQAPLIHIQIPAYLSPSGIAIDRYAIPNSVDETYNTDHTVDSSIHYTFETTGVAGKTKPVPPPSVNVYPNLPVVGNSTPAPTALPTGMISYGTANMALFCVNGLLLTGDFQTSPAHDGPTYTFSDWASLSVSGTFLGWCPRGGTNGEGWIVTSTKLYYFSIPTLTATDITPGSWGTSSKRSLDAAFPTAGMHFAASCYFDGVGITVFDTQDNSSFTTTVLSTNHAASDSGFGIYPGCFVSTRNPGKVLTSRYTNNGSIFTPGSATSEGRASTDYSASFGALSLHNSTLLTQHIHVPWNDNPSESIYYYGAFVDIAGADGARLYRNATDISPVISGNHLMPRSRDAMCTAVSNRQRMLAVLQAGTTNDYAVVLSDDAGAGSPTWTVLDGLGTSYRRGALSGNDVNTGWVWGVTDIAQLTLSSSSGAFESRAGNLASFTPGEIIAIAGF